MKKGKIRVRDGWLMADFGMSDIGLAKSFGGCKDSLISGDVRSDPETSSG
jgi:hypothetical protein